jgi:two-component system, sensor histidine kinase PdtaS
LLKNIFILLCTVAGLLIWSNLSFAQSFQKNYSNFINEKDPNLRSYKASILANYYIQVNDDSIQYFKKEMLKHISKGKLSEAGLLHLEVQESLVAGVSENVIVKAKIAKEIYEKYNEKSQANVLGILVGLIYCENSDFIKSGDEYLKVYHSLRSELKKNPNNKDNISNYTLLLDHLSYLYYSSGDHKKSLMYDLENVRFCEKSATSIELAVALSNLGSSYLQTKDITNAILTYKRCAEIRKKNIVPSLMGHSEFRLAGCYYNQKDYLKAYSFMLKSLEMRSLYKNNFVNQALIDNLYGIILHELGRDLEANEICLKAFQSELAQTNKSVKKEACECMHKVNKSLGNFKVAFHYLEVYTAISDSIFDREKEANITIKTKFIGIENDRFQDSVAQFEAKRYETVKLKQQEKTIRHTYLWFALLILVLIGLIFTIRYLRKLNQKNILVKKQISDAISEKEVLLREIHHRVKNNFQVISSLLNIQVNTLESKEQINSLREAQNRILSMALVHQKMYGSDGNYSHINMNSYFKDLISFYIDDDSKMRDRLKVNIETNGILLDLDRAVPLGLLSNEIFTNALKYGCSTNYTIEITVLMEERSGHYCIHFSDKGNGFNKDVELEKETSIGLELIEILADQLDAKLSFYNDFGAHTELKFMIIPT